MTSQAFRRHEASLPRLKHRLEIVPTAVADAVGFMCANCGATVDVSREVLLTLLTVPNTRLDNSKFRGWSICRPAPISHLK